MDRTLLGKVLKEIDAARQIADCKLTLIQCDYQIQSVDTYEPWDLISSDFSFMKFKGRGGTSFTPPFDWIKEQTAEGSALPDALIYMTDGYGSEPKELPNHECLWVVPEGGAKEFSFGQVVEIAKS